MDELSKDYIIDFFTKRFIHFKDTPPSVGWSKEGQLIRYSKIFSLLPLNGMKVLDFGCGKGDFYEYLTKHGIDCEYTGIDINPVLVGFASKKFRNARFIVMDIEDGIEEDFDYVIACGVFNLNIDGVKEYAFNAIRLLYMHTIKTLLFTCLDRRQSRKDPFLYYFDRDELIDLASSLTDDYILVDDAIPGDIFLFLRKGLEHI